MRPTTRSLSYKAKFMKMYAGQFYLRPALHKELLSMLEHGLIVSDRQAVEFISNYGEWLE